MFEGRTKVADYPDSWYYVKLKTYDSSSEYYNLRQIIESDRFQMLVSSFEARL